MKLESVFNRETDFVMIEKLMSEDYPTPFNMDEFKRLPNFKKRIEYCDANLQKIRSGSGRIVYKIDNEKVLKLAKNKKGVAQNEVEADYSRYDDIFAKVFDFDSKEYFFVEMELARRVTPNIFRNIVGINFDDFGRVLENAWTEHNPRRRRGGYIYHVKPEIQNQADENDWYQNLMNAMLSYDLPAGDLTRLSSYGLVNRGGQDQIVLIDYGLSNSVYSTYYS